MKRTGRLRGATLGATLAYTAAALAHGLPMLRYYPLSVSWTLERFPGEPVVSWYGAVAYAVLGGLLGGAVSRWLGRTPSPRLVWMASIAAFLLLTWHERGWFAP